MMTTDASQELDEINYDFFCSSGGKKKTVNYTFNLTFHFSAARINFSFMEFFLLYFLYELIKL